MKRIILIPTIIFLLLHCNKNNDLQKAGENAQVSRIADLPEVLKESSGVEIAESGTFWSFNDSNGATEIYRFDESGNLLQTVSIENAGNKDWEDIAKDEQGNLYIGDFGNNDNDRKNLRIYKINALDLEAADTSVAAEKIDFSFSDQTEFPPPPMERSFDVESIFAKGDFLYLLTKERSVPFIGKTKLYRLPNLSGDQIAEFVDEFSTDNDENKGQITAADISPDLNTLALLSNGSVWLFQNLEDEDFFSSEVRRCDFSKQSDLEGIVFKDATTLYLTNEEKSDSPASLYKMEISN